ncbi:hypothetical protein [Hymenobacter sp. BRD67]|uniref:hypothetical protein n=1 Tax=Hymenobacter sp. BRD67 TaxID=2675877 RepID=UPI0015653AE8|nr:hypothetical protein [Hymenobacter sp. BRD67]QKG53976.1 hypothetical protein GKZ67_16920 [Hymenobacter sp. BRD67]
MPNDKASVLLVTELKNPGEDKPLLWDSFDLIKEVTAKSSVNRWCEVDHLITLPKGAPFTSWVKVYMWRITSTQPAYLDDLQLLRAD